jgi:uncharacterized membrane protein
MAIHLKSNLRTTEYFNKKYKMMLKTLCILSNKISILALDILVQGRPFSLLRKVKTMAV